MLEGVAFALADGLDVLKAAGAPLTTCMLVGGGARSRFWGQMLADVLQIPLQLPKGAEIGAALGAARLAMLAAGGGSEAEFSYRRDRGRFCSGAGVFALFAPRLARYRALYPAEKGRGVAQGPMLDADSSPVIGGPRIEVRG